MAINPNFLETLRRFRAQNGRNGLRRKAPRWLYPSAQERAYAAALVRDLRALEAAVKTMLIDRLPMLVIEAETVMRGDEFVQDIRTIMDAVGVRAGDIFSNGEALALTTATATAAFNSAQYRKIIQAVLGVNPLTSDSYLDTLVRGFARENSLLIQSIPRNLLVDVEGIAYRGMLGGALPRDIAADIRARFKVSRNRARLLARDQVGKLNGQLSQARQERVGVVEYIWQTVEDERVRKSHRVLDGKICRWDDPTVYREPNGTEWLPRANIGGFIGTPGSDYQCRCFSDPIFDDVIDATA